MCRSAAGKLGMILLYSQAHSGTSHTSHRLNVIMHFEPHIYASQIARNAASDS